MTPSPRTQLLRVASRLYPWPVDASDELVRSLGFLDADVDAETVVRGGYGAAVVAGACSLAVVAVVTANVLLTVSVASVAGLGCAHLVHRAPVLLASAKRTRALGETTGLVGRAVLRMRIDPTAERAVRFAARTGRGPLADSLGDHARRAAGTPETGLAGFAREWREWFPALNRATSLVDAAAAAPAAERERTLDRALDAALGGTRDRMTAFAGEIRGPATGLYAFGVLLPLALVGILPAARVAGVAIALWEFALVYDVLLPAGVVVAAGWLLTRRPVAFPPARVTGDHPEVPMRPWRALGVGFTGAALAFAVASRVVAWSGPLAAAGVGVGSGLVVRYRPIKRVRDEVRAVESGLPDALYLVGRRVTDGTAVETAIARASDEVDGATGEVLADAVRVQRALRVGVHEAFLGEYGALSDVPSPRARGTAGLLALAAREGRPAGSAVVAMADQLQELRRVERDARHELAAVTGTLGNTAALFAPLVGGATVALADRMADAGGGSGAASNGASLVSSGAGASTASASSATAMQPLSTAALGPAVGAYVLLLAVVLTALAVGLERGVDRALIGYRVGFALLSATATYLAAVVGAGLLV